MLKKEILELRKVFKTLFYNSKDTLKDRAISVSEKNPKQKTIQKLLIFLEKNQIDLTVCQTNE